MANENQNDNVSGDSFLKRTIIALGVILVIFVGLFTYRMYYPARAPINITMTTPVVTTIMESQPLFGELDSRITQVEQNMNSQLESYAATLNPVAQQVSTLYSMFNNSLMIFTIILGMFTLIIAVLGFYISSVISNKYKQIKDINDEVIQRQLELMNEVKRKSDKLFSNFIQNDTKRLIKTLKKSPQNILNIRDILAVREIKGEENWRIMRSCIIELGKSKRLAPDYNEPGAPYH